MYIYYMIGHAQYYVKQNNLFASLIHGIIALAAENYKTAICGHRLIGVFVLHVTTGPAKAVSILKQSISL